MNATHADLEVRRQFFKTHYKIFASKENLELLEVFAFRVRVISVNHM